MEIKPDKANELHAYLQRELQLASSYCEKARSDPELKNKLYEKLKPLHEEMRDALQVAYPDDSRLEYLIEYELGLSPGEIPSKMESYANRLFEMIKLAAREGYLIELIAAAHKRTPHNPRLDLFVKKDLEPLIEDIIPSHETGQTQIPQRHAILPTIDNNVGANGNETIVIDNDGVDGNNGVATSDIGAYVSLQTNGTSPPLPTPITSKLSSKSHSSLEDLITQADELIREAQHVIQTGYDMFLNGEQIDEGEVIEYVKEAKAKVKKLPNIVDPIPVPNYPDLPYRLVGEQEYFCEKADLIILSLSKVKLQPPYSAKSEQGVKIKLEHLLQSLEQSEDLIRMYAQQVQQLNKTDEFLSGGGS